MDLSYSKTTVSIIRKNNAYISRQFFCLNSLHSFATEKKLESYKKVCENKDFYDVIIAYEELKYQNLINIKNLIKHYLLSMQILNI